MDVKHAPVSLLRLFAKLRGEVELFLFRCDNFDMFNRLTANLKPNRLTV